MEALVTDAPAAATLDFLMAKNMAELLHRHYPGHLWAVTCDGQTGMATVRNMALDGNWGFQLHLDTSYSGSEWDKRVVMAGGEVLERYRIARSKANHDQLAHLPTNFAGRHAVDMG